MNPVADWERVRAAFDAVADLAPQARDAQLDLLLPRGTAERAEVERMLGAEERAGTFLEPLGDRTLGAAIDGAATRILEPGTRVGSCEVVRPIAVGGMGVVYEARQESPRRRVALKLMRPGLGSPNSRRRFHDEIEVLARMRHPGIAQVYEAGTWAAGGRTGTDDDVPWFAMELLEGAEPITDWAARRELPPAARLELFLDVCGAVEHAHQRGVIHRDLKRENVLVDAEGRVKVIDFGVALTVEPHATELYERTQPGELIGTLLSMSPEQLAGGGADIDIRTDVYALGVLLFWLLCDVPPFDLRGRSLAEALRVLAEREPPRPSSIAPHLPAELDWIAGKAMAKERSARYGSVHELRADVRRFLAEEPVLAGPLTTGYRLRKFVRRHRAGVSIAVAVVLGFVLAFVGIALALLRAREAERRAQLERTAAVGAGRRAETTVDFLLDLFSAVHPSHRAEGESPAVARERAGREVKMADALHLAARQFERRFAAEPEIRAAIGNTVGVAYLGLGLLDEAEEFLRRSTRVREQLAAEGPDLGRVLTNLAVVQLRRGHLDEAERFLGRADQALATGPADALPALVAGLHRGELLILRGKHAAAAELLRDVLARMRATHPDRHRSILLTIGMLASALHELGDLAAAEPLYREAVEGLTALVGEDHPDTLTAMNNLVMVLYARGQKDETVATMERLLAARRRVLGNDHPDTIATVNNLGGVMYANGRFEDAARYWREGLERLGSGERTGRVRLTLLSNLGAVERSLGHHERAIELTEEVWRIRKESLGEAHERTLAALNGLAECHRAARDYERALELFGRARELALQHLPSGHPALYHSQMGIGRAALALHRFEQAEAMLLACRAAFAEAQRQSAMKGMVVRPEPDLVALYEAWGRLEDAARYRAAADGR